jgi:cytochrome c-type biogenesis protein CcmH
MHKDVMALVAGGYSAQEIIDAFTKVYGPRVLMEPPRRGFNLAGYFTPSVVLLAGIALVIVLIRRWHRPPELDAGVRQLPVDASPDELDRLQRLVKRDDA